MGMSRDAVATQLLVGSPPSAGFLADHRHVAVCLWLAACLNHEQTGYLAWIPLCPTLPGAPPTSNPPDTHLR